MPTPPTFTTGAVLTAAQMNTIAMHKISTTTISAGVSTASVNNCFSADYDNYRIIMLLNGSTSGSFARMRLRVGGVDLAGANYYRYGYSVAFGTALASYNAAAETSFLVVGQWVGSLGSTCVMDISAPFSSTLRTHWVCNTNDVGAGGSYNLNGLVDVNTSYDGFTVIPNAGTLNAGTITVYGYRK